MYPVTHTEGDIFIQVGTPPVFYPAHKNVLYAESAYFKNYFRDTQSTHSRIYILPFPNIRSEIFGIILNYMYTGILNVTEDSVMETYLAAHYLGMPRATIECWSIYESLKEQSRRRDILNLSFLNSLNGIVRPIASRPIGPAISFVAPPKSNNDFIPIHVTTPIPTEEIKSNENNNVTTISPVNEIESINNNSSSNEMMETIDANLKANDTVHLETKPSDKVDENIIDRAEQFIIDVASCDGPVRFTRVINEAYGQNVSQTTVERTAVLGKMQENATTSFHQQMAKNISDSQAKACDILENRHINSDKVTTGGYKFNDEVYICVYCKHTFKSQYCYQKHAKRHLNPLTLKSDCIGAQDISSVKCGKTRKVNSSTDSTSSTDVALILKREVKPLDMNVQYYPCKTCGSKFPSYYFVHKHRKYCQGNDGTDSK